MATAVDVCLSTCVTTTVLHGKPTTRGRIAGSSTAGARTMNASSSSYTCRALQRVSTRRLDMGGGGDILPSLSLSSSSTSASSVAIPSSRSYDCYSTSSTLPPSLTSTQSPSLTPLPSTSLIPVAGRRLASLCLRQRRSSSGGGVAAVGRRRRLLCSTSSQSTWLPSSFPSSSSSSRARRGRTRPGSRGGALTSTCRNGNGGGRGGGGISSTSCSSSAIDVVATLKTERILILGGSGFVGSAIAKSALKQGIEVVSLSRTGRSPYGGESGAAMGGVDASSSSSSSSSSFDTVESTWADQVTWVTGDVFAADWSTLLEGVTTVVSCIGGFGNNEQMEKINGEANVQAVVAARQAGVGRFIYISVHDYNLPSFVLSVGYFSGKQRAEKAVLENFPSTGVILRPGFIYGKRKVNGVDLALDQVGEPLEKLLEGIDSWIKPFKALPASDLLLLPPVSVEDVADAAVKGVIDDSIAGILDVQAIKETAASLFTPA